MGNDAISRRAWFDGTLESNGRAAFGFIITHGDRVVATCAGYLGDGPGIDSMAAEFAALDALLRYLVISELTGPIVICGDCAPVLAIAQEQCRVGECYERQVSRIMAARALLPPLTFEWIPRGQNSQAHALARSALRHYSDMNPQGAPSNGPQPAQPHTAKRRGAKLRRKARQFLSRIIDRL